MDDEYIYASCVILLVSFLGIVWNVMGVIIVIRSPHLHNSFGYLCLSHSIANAGVCFIFLAWVSPLTIWQLKDETMTALAKRFGQVNIFFWDACVYSHLAVSVNRSVSIWLPVKSNRILGRRNTVILIAFVWFLGFCHVVPYFWLEDCYITYDPIGWVWNFAGTYCGYVISTYTDCATGFTVLGLMICIDSTTFYKIHSSNNAVIAMGGSSKTNKRRRMEVKFFTQSICQTVLFSLELICFYFVCNYTVTQWQLFFSTTFAWEACHACDGLILTSFNFRKEAFFRLRTRRRELTISARAELTSGQQTAIMTI